MRFKLCTQDMYGIYDDSRAWTWDRLAIAAQLIMVLVIFLIGGFSTLGLLSHTPYPAICVAGVAFAVALAIAGPAFIGYADACIDQERRLDAVRKSSRQH